MSFSHLHDPLDIVRRPQFEPEVKRAILASWASDDHAVEDHPALRQSPGLDRPVRYDDVMTALRSLEGGS